MHIMQMTEEEIVRSYKQAASPHKQITVLAELNGTNTATIRDILRDNGIEIKKPGPKPKPIHPNITTIFREKSDKPTKVLQIPKSVEALLKTYLNELTEKEDDLKAQLAEVAKTKREVEEYITFNGGVL